MIRGIHFLLAVGSFGVFLALSNQLWFTVDDAYISMRYARHLSDGVGLVYNPGEYVEGYTSLLWVVMLAAAHALGFRLVQAAGWLGVACSVLTLVFVHRLASDWVPGRHRFVPLVAVTFLASNWIFAGWTTGGLETALFTAAATGCVFTYHQSATGSRRAASLLPLCCLVLTWTRPEGVLLSAVLAIAAVTAATGTTTARRVLPWIGLYALPIAAHVAWRLYYYGDWLPNTFYAKVTHAQYVERGWAFFSSFVIDAHAYAWAAAALLAAAHRRPVGRVIGVYAALYVAYTIWVGGDWMGYRFYHHLLALVSVPIAACVGAAVDILRANGQMTVWRTPRHAVTVVAAMAALGGSAATARKSFSEQRQVRYSFGELIDFNAMNLPEQLAVDVARGLDAVLAPDEAAAGSFAGFTAVFTDRPVIDIHGLNDRYIARLPPVWRGTPGHERRAPGEYLIARNVLLVNPWGADGPGGPQTPFAVMYAPGAYLHFDIVLPMHVVVERLQSRGFVVFARGERLFNPHEVESIALDLNFDFEDGTWRDWNVEGRAFGATPRHMQTWDNTPRIVGRHGQYLINSFHENSDGATGLARSRPFTITGDVMHFLVGGGNGPRTALELWVDGRLVQSASGLNSEQLLRRHWDVAPFRGRMASLVIRDEESGPWGHVLVDDIRLAAVR